MEEQVEENIRKVNDTILQPQAQLYKRQLKIKLDTSPKERKMKQKVNESLDSLQRPDVVRPKCQWLSQVIEELYMNLSVAPKWSS